MNRWQKWWSKAPVAEAAAKAFPSDPERYAKLLEEELESPVAKDPSFAAELQTTGSMCRLRRMASRRRLMAKKNRQIHH